MKKHFFFSFLCFLLISSYVTAQDGSDMPFSMNGYGRASVYGGGDKYALSSVFSELSLQTSVTGSHSFGSRYPF